MDWSMRIPLTVDTRKLAAIRRFSNANGSEFDT